MPSLASKVVELHSRVSPQPAAQYLAFTNPGLLEIELVKLLGVSVKESADPIGFFGTGLKYALATALRLGGSVTIITGDQRYEVTGQAITLRDKQFTQVMLNGEPLGFTTELGKQWEAWMVVRELYSNALDEDGGAWITGADPFELSDTDRTVIALYGQCFLDVWNERDRYFIDLERKEPWFRTEYVDVYPERGRAVFYRGIRIHETQLPTRYKYNLLSKTDLTEDRTLKYAFMMDAALEKAIISSPNREFVMQTLMAGELHHEGHLVFTDSHHGVELSEAFKQVCSELQERMPEGVNKHALRFYQRKTNVQQPMIPAVLTRVQQMQLDKAVAFVRKIGCDCLDIYPIEVVKWLGQNQHGLAKDGRIYLATDCFDRGTKYVASTLFEEYVHCHHGFSDESRQLQTWLFDRVVTMGEELHGEPL